MRLRLGDIVPTDAQLREGEPVEVDSSALTGESLPVEKKPGETVYGDTCKKSACPPLAKS